MIVSRIVFDGGRSRVDCIIRNLSQSGAKLEVASVKSIPNSFDLIAPGHRPHACHVVWRALREWAWSSDSSTAAQDGFLYW